MNTKRGTTNIRSLLGLAVCAAAAISGCRSRPSGNADSATEVTAVTDSSVFADGVEDIFPSSQAVTQRRLAIVAAEVARYRRLRGRMPSRLDDVLDLPPEGPDLNPQVRWLEDGWGRRLRLTFGRGGEEFDLRSSGLDGKFDTEDDVVAHDR